MQGQTRRSALFLLYIQTKKGLYVYKKDFLDTLIQIDLGIQRTVI